MNVLSYRDMPESDGKTPTMYDVRMDDERPVTQADVDDWINAVQIMVRQRDISSCLEQMTRDALTGAISRESYLEMTGAFLHAYTSEEAQARERGPDWRA
jgi:NH3-dependent NAD+ synthetase